MSHFSYYLWTYPAPESAAPHIQSLRRNDNRLHGAASMVGNPPDHKTSGLVAVLSIPYRGLWSPVIIRQHSWSHATVVYFCKTIMDSIIIVDGEVEVNVDIFGPQNRALEASTNIIRLASTLRDLPFARVGLFLWSYMAYWLFTARFIHWCLFHSSCVLSFSTTACIPASHFKAVPRSYSIFSENWKMSITTSKAIWIYCHGLAYLKQMIYLVTVAKEPPQANV